MAKKNKPFDCVEMKERIQAEIRADYEARKDQFASYADYLEASIKEDPWASAVLEKLTGGEKAKTSGR